MPSEIVASSFLIVAASAEPDASPRAMPPRGGQRMARLIDASALRAAYEAGDSATELARRHGVSPKTIDAKLRAAGARMRGVGEAAKVRARSAWIHLDKPEPVAGRPEVDDAFGVAHRVTSLTRTDLGWDILRGYAVASPGSPGVILTGALAAHLARHRLRPGRSDLPLSAATLTRLRRKLALDWRAEKRAWWEARRAELAEVETKDFAARHGAGPAMVNHVRRKFHGKRRHPRSAWLDEEAMTLILSPTLAVEAIAQTLGLSAAYVYELRAEFATGRRKGT